MNKVILTREKVDCIILVIIESWTADICKQCSVV